MKVPEKHKAIAHAWVDGAKVEGRDLKATCTLLNEWWICEHPAWHKDWEYRIKLTKPSINWEHVSPKYVALATDKHGYSYLFTKVPEATTNNWATDRQWKSAEVFQSFERGTCDWKDSLVIRPSADSEEQK